jgi:hypothetical protein
MRDRSAGLSWQHLQSLVQMKRYVGIFLLWVLGSILTFVSLKIHAPYEIFLHDSGVAIVLAASLIALTTLPWRRLRHWPKKV